MAKKKTTKDLTKAQEGRSKMQLIIPRLTPAELADLITVKEAAAIRRISVPSLYELIYRGRMIPVEIAGRKFLRRSEVEQFEKFKPGPKPRPKAKAARKTTI